MVMPLLQITDKEMKALCRKALGKDGNISRAAKKIGLSRPCFRKHATKYGLWPRKKVEKQAA